MRYTGQAFRQAPHRMHLSISRYSPVTMSDLPLSSKTMCISSAPVDSPGFLVPVITDMYVVSACPVAERGSKRVNLGRSPNDGTIFSMDSTTMWTGGRVVHIRPFPSFVKRTMLPESATAKLAPDIPAFADRNSSLRTFLA